MKGQPANDLVRQEQFDYNQLPASKRRQIQQEAEAIRQLLKKTASQIVQIGLRLQLVRDAIGREHFQHWLRAEFHWSQSVASNFMRAAAAFSNVDCLGQFQPSALYVLARRRIPEAARQEAFERARTGELITKARAKAIASKYDQQVRQNPPVKLSVLRQSLRRAVASIRALDRETLVSAADDLGALISELQAAVRRYRRKG